MIQWATEMFFRRGIVEAFVGDVAAWFANVVGIAYSRNDHQDDISVPSHSPVGFSWHIEL